MSANNLLPGSYFSFFYPHNYCYEKKKELRPDYQAVILVNQRNS
ncbi:MAG: hypothetical protein ACI9P5_004174 [Saprospiraceae bacterium]|jgi:hypothetical protein